LGQESTGSSSDRLDQYATEAREEMKTWMSEEEIEALFGGDELIDFMYF
jgi:hypothetical protein